MKSELKRECKNEKHIEKYIELNITKTEDIHYLCCFGENWLFRGQNNKDWKLKTSIEREIEKSGNNDTTYLERNLISYFQRQAHSFIDNLPEERNYIAWLSYIQHHGGVTRLLDFSRSMYIGLYFAVRKLDFSSDSALWGINYGKLWECLSDFHQINYTSSNYVEFNKYTFWNFGDGRSFKEVILHFEPHFMNKRMSAQQGTFLIPSHYIIPFEEALLKTFQMDLSTFEGNKPIQIDSNNSYAISQNANIIKVIIPSYLRKEILHLLNKMNINEKTLFPDMDGLAKYLNYKMYEKGDFVW